MKVMVSHPRRRLFQGCVYVNGHTTALTKNTSPRVGTELVQHESEQSVYSNFGLIAHVG